MFIREKRSALYEKWRAEEKNAAITGWDFSYIDGRCEEIDPPWDYRAEILKRLSPGMQLLDLDTGGGEFLLSLGHPYKNTAAMEVYAPNVALCRERLLSLGIDFREGGAGEGCRFPFEDGRFSMVIDRHGDLNPAEIYRVLAPGGIFITQQVGAENERELVELLLGAQPLPFPKEYLRLIREDFERCGFEIERGEEAFSPIRFFDVSALVWFAKIIEWEFSGFSVEKHFENLLHAQELLEKEGKIEGSAHRILLIARKPLFTSA